MSLNFEQLPDSKAARFLNEAGIHVNYAIEEIVQTEASLNKEGKIVNGTLKITVKNDDGVQFTITQWEPAGKPEDLKYIPDKYVKGVKVGKMTPDEAIQANFTTLFYFYEQLAKAAQQNVDNVVQWRKAMSGAPETLWKKFYEEYFKRMPLEAHIGKKIDFKALWNNNDKGKTSYLEIAKPSQSSVVLAPGGSNTLGFTSFEEAKLKRRYHPSDKAPKNNSTEAGGWSPGAAAADGAPAAQDGVDGDLF